MRVYVTVSVAIGIRYVAKRITMLYLKKVINQVISFIYINISYLLVFIDVNYLSGLKLHYLVYCIDRAIFSDR